MSTPVKVQSGFLKDVYGNRSLFVTTAIATWWQRCSENSIARFATFLFCWTLIWTKTLFKSECAFVFSEAWNKRIHKLIGKVFTGIMQPSNVFFFFATTELLSFFFVFCTAPAGHEKDCKFKTFLFQKFSEHQIFSGLVVWLVHLQIVINAVSLFNGKNMLLHSCYIFKYLHSLSNSNDSHCIISVFQQKQKQLYQLLWQQQSSAYGP